MPFMTLPDTGEHVLVRLNIAANGDETWGCGECGQTRIINWSGDAHRNQLTQPGDFFAHHSLGHSPTPEMDAGVTLLITSGIATGR